MDKKAKKILMSTFWSNKGCKDYRTIEFCREDFEYAKAKGLMFDPISIHHDECVARLKRVAEGIKKEELAAAFLSSLSTRALYLRSAILSWIFAKELPSHNFSTYIDSCGNTQMNYLCGICNQRNMSCSESYKNEDLNVLNFERIKPDCGPRQLEQALKDVFKSSKDERDVVIEILACIGVLQQGREDRPMRGGKNDWHFAENWCGEDGFSKKTIQLYFDIKDV